MQRTCLPALVVAALLCIHCGLTAAADEAGQPDSKAKSDATIAGNPEFAINTGGLKYGCFYARDVSNWEALNTDYLIAYAPNRKRAFLVRFGPPSFELRSAVTIGFEGRDRICGRPGERLIIGTNINSARMRYGILDVWQLDAVTVDRLLENRKARGSAKVQPAGASPGAVVETDIKVNAESDSNEAAAASEPE